MLKMSDTLSKILGININKICPETLPYFHKVRVVLQKNSILIYKKSSFVPFGFCRWETYDSNFDELDHLIRKANWLTSAKHCFCFDSQLSHGVPQGSILGTMLFALYMNIKYSHVESFVDDTKIYLYFAARDVDSCLAQVKRSCVALLSGAVLTVSLSTQTRQHLFLLENCSC